MVDGLGLRLMVEGLLKVVRTGEKTLVEIGAMILKTLLPYYSL